MSVSLASLPTTYDVAQFGPCSDPVNTNNINILTYNRIVGQAMLVSINTLAMKANNQLYNDNTDSVWNAVQQFGGALTTALNNSSTFASSFNQVSQYANTSKLGVNLSTGSNLVNYNPSTYKVGYMRQGLASNIYIPQDLYNDLSGLDSNGNADDINAGNQKYKFQSTLQSFLNPVPNNNTGALTFTPNTTAFKLSPAITGAPLQTGGSAGYLKGYTNIPFSTTGSSPVTSSSPTPLPGFVPVVPFNPPHLVSKTESSDCYTALSTWEGNYNRSSGKGPPPASGYNAVEFIKANLLTQRATGATSINLTALTQNNGVSGMNVTQFQSPPTKTTLGTGHSAPPQPTQNNGGSPLYSTPGTPLELLMAVGNSSTQLTAGSAL